MAHVRLSKENKAFEAPTDSMHCQALHTCTSLEVYFVLLHNECSKLHIPTLRRYDSVEHLKVNGIIIWLIFGARK